MICWVTKKKKKKRRDGAERLDFLTVKSYPVKCKKKLQIILFSVFNKDTISLGMLN